MANIPYLPQNQALRCLNGLLRRFPARSKFQFTGLLLKKELRRELPELKVEGYEFGIADINDIKLISAQSESREYKVYRSRLSKGHFCLWAKNQNNIMSYVWVALNTCGIMFGTENETSFFALGDTQACAYDLYTYRKYRNKGIATQFMIFISHFLRSKGITQLYSLVVPGNMTSMIIFLRHDYEPQQLIHVFGMRLYKKVFLERPRDVNEFKEWQERYIKAHQRKGVK